MRGRTILRNTTAILLLVVSLALTSAGLWWLGLAAVVGIFAAAHYI